MSFLGSSTRQVNVYGRRGKTRIIATEVEEGEEVLPSPPPKAPAKGLFSSLDLPAWGQWMASPRKALSALSPRKPGTGDKAANDPGASTAADRSQSSSPTPTPDALTDQLHTLSLTDPPMRAQRTSLLASAHQTEPASFAACLDTLLADGSVAKVGEASYSEVYRIVREEGQGTARPRVSVMKVIPLEVSAPVKGPALSPLASVEREIQVTRALSPSGTEGTLAPFVRLQEAWIVEGAYPPSLLAAWDKFKECDARSENVRPDVFAPTQWYALLCLDDAGSELEHTALASWKERAAVFWQTVYAVAYAETAYELEHRDLHLSNILVARCAAWPVEPATSAASFPGTLPLALWQRYAPAEAHIRATIIDYSLSRMVLDGKVLAYDFSDPSLFTGQGDEQYEIYRTMRSLAAGDWHAFHPSTNVVWLHFLAHRLLLTEEPPEADASKDEVVAYASLLLAEQMADDAIEAIRRAAPKRNVSTRSKRRSIQRGPDAWKMGQTLRAQTITSAHTFLQASVAALDHE